MTKNFYTTVEINDYHVKILQGLRDNGSAQLARCLIRPVNGNAGESVPAVLQEFLAGNEVEMDKFYAVIPRRHFIYRRLRLPSLQAEEIRRMIGLQIHTLVPYSREDVIFDWVPVGENDGTTDLLAVIVPCEVVRRLTDLLNRAHLRPSRFVPASFGLLNWYLTQQNKRAVDETSAAMLIDADYGGAEIVFCRREEMLYSRYLPGDPGHVLPERETLLKEIRISLKAFMQENPGIQVKEAVVTAGNHGESMAAFLKEALGLPVAAQNSFSALSYVDHFDYALLRNYGQVSVMSCIGFLCEPRTRWPNLVPEEVLHHKRQAGRRVQLLRLGSAAVSCLLLMSALVGVRVWKDQRYLSRLKEENKRLGLQVEDARRVNEAIRRLPVISGERFLAAELFKTLYEVSPEGLSFRSVSLENDGTLVIQGEAGSGGSVNELQQQLLSAKGLTDVSLEYVAQRRRYDGEYTEFKITCRLSGGEERADEPI